MKKMPSVTSEVETTTDDLPLIPGTEAPRSLGDLMRDAEAASQASGEAADNGADARLAMRPRKPRKPSRAQSRRFARERVLQALYQLDVSSGISSTIRQEFVDNQDMSRVDIDYFMLLFNGVNHDMQKLDDTLKDCLDRPIEDLDPIERSVLRMTTYELGEQLDIPARVVINEGIEITKRFGADKGHRYINGVLDKLAMNLRPQEMKRR